MSVRIRLKRLGAKKRPYYRVVVADQRSPRDGRFIENIGVGICPNVWDQAGVETLKGWLCPKPGGSPQGRTKKVRRPIETLWRNGLPSR